MDFVTFDIANKLKEKGFPQEKRDALAMYSEEGEWYSLARNLDEFEYTFEDFDNHDCVCPTISQVLKWLRKEHNLYVCPTLNTYRGKRKKDKAYNLWMFQVKNIANNNLIYPNPLDMHDVYETYEQAALAGIEYVLDKLN